MKDKRKIKLERKEQEILEKIDKKDQDMIFVFDIFKLYFYVDDLINNKNHSMLIKLIYLERKDLVKWVQANTCNIGHRTAFRYRNLYVRLLNILYKEDKLKNFISNHTKTSNIKKAV